MIRILYEYADWLQRAAQRLYDNLETAKWEVVNLNGGYTTIHRLHVPEVGYAEIEINSGSNYGGPYKYIQVHASALNEKHKRISYNLSDEDDFYISKYGKKSLVPEEKWKNEHPSMLVLKSSQDNKKIIEEFIKIWKPLLKDYMAMVIEDKIAMSDRD